MSYGKNVLGLKVLESVSFIEKGTALTIELFNNEACIRPATSNDTVVGVALEDYTRGVANLNGDKISVSIIEFSPGIAGSNISAGSLLGVNDSGKFIVSSKNIIGVAISNGKLGELFQFVRIFSKEGSGSSGEVSKDYVDTQDNTVKKYADDRTMELSEAVSYEIVKMENKINIVENGLENRKQNKLIEGSGIAIDKDTNTISVSTNVIQVNITGSSSITVSTGKIFYYPDLKLFHLYLSCSISGNPNDIILNLDKPLANDIFGSSGYFYMSGYGTSTKRQHSLSSWNDNQIKIYKDGTNIFDSLHIRQTMPANI